MMGDIEFVGRQIAAHIHAGGDYGLDGDTAYEMRKKEFDDLAAAILKATWQPIETAPKDGTRIIVYRPRGNDYIKKVGVDYWDKGLLGGCWANSNRHDEIQPSDWMPLPEPPNAR